MPEMKLGNAPADFFSGYRLYRHHYIGEADLRLRAYMSWPKDERARDNYCATTATAYYPQKEEDIRWTDDYGPLGSDKKQLVLSEIQNIIQRDFLSPVGGIKAVALMPSLDDQGEALTEGTSRCLVAGHILRYVYLQSHVPEKLNGGPSVNKAQELLRKFDEAKRSIDWYNERWRSHRNVSHVGAAIVTLRSGAVLKAADGLPFNDEEITGPAIGYLLSYARFYQRFACNFIPEKNANPLIDPEAIWAVPSDYVLPEVPPPVQHWAGDELKFVRKWQIR